MECERDESRGERWTMGFTWVIGVGQERKVCYGLSI